MKGDTWNSPQDPLGIYLSLFESLRTVSHEVEGAPQHTEQRKQVEGRRGGCSVYP